MSLPKSSQKGGYTRQEILDIIRPLGVHHRTFWKAFGVNTACIGEKGETLFYGCDIERALYQLRKPGGKFHMWD